MPQVVPQPHSARSVAPIRDTDNRVPGTRMLVVAVLVALLGLAAAASWYWWPASVRTAPVRSRPASSSAADLPPGLPTVVEDVRYLDVSPDAARTINNSRPFVTTGNVPAAPFAFAGSPEDRQRALTCLAAAVYYEAGDDPIGMQAVAQVVLNRVRHPAFPKSVCGVVFQGAERPTGCQFTFTCDGALNRPVSPPVWIRARQIAEGALSGYVFRYIGLATHYHTDWVVPYWSPTMDKIAQVHTHLFFRWRGGWGTPAAFRRGWQGPEVIDPRIAAMVEPVPGAKIDPAAVALIDMAGAERAAPGETPGNAAVALASVDFDANHLRLSDATRNQFGLELAPDAFPGSYAVLANKICASLAPCRVVGWRNPTRIPAAIGRDGAWTRGATFVFEKTAAGDQRVHWNCKEIPRENAHQCLPT